jgi:hypothetical protein
MPTHTWKHDACELLRRLDPEAGALYLLDMAETKTDPCGCQGVTSILYDLCLRDSLKERGEWQGRGFTCLIAATEIFASFHKTGLPYFDARRKVLAVAIHEYCHFLEARPLMSEDRADAILESAPDLARYLRETPITVGADDPNADPSRHHDGLRFGRLASHALHRANVWAGFELFHANDIWTAADVYGLAGPTLYAQALGDEPQRLIGEPLRSIVNSPLPERYAEFCHQDLERARAVLAANRKT